MTEPQAPSLKLADIYYVLFRQKRLIAGFLAAGLMAAVIVYAAKKPLYSSEAKLLLRYVVDRKAIEAGTGGRVTAPENTSESIISSEIEIFYSLDLCEEVAGIIGPEKLLPRGVGNTNLNEAALAVHSGLTVENSPRRSNIIKVRFTHGDPSICQMVLRSVIDSYFRRHKKIHTESSNDDALSDQANALLVRINQNEEARRNLMAKAGVISVEDAKKSLGEQLARLRLDIFASEAQLAEYRAVLGMKAPAAANPKDTAPEAAPPEKITEYKSVVARLDLLRNKEFELLAQFTEENPQVKRLRDQIADYTRRKAVLETEHTNLVTVYVAQPLPSAGMPLESRPDAARVRALERKLELFTNQLEIVRGDVVTLENLESSLLNLRRQLELDQQNYMHLAGGMRDRQIDQALNAGALSNIQPVQTPSPPMRNATQRAKSVGVAIFGFLFAGIALAFVLEMFVDRTVRRPAELEAKVQVPLFLSIPRLSMNGHSKLLPFPETSAKAVAAPDPETDLKATWAADHPLRPFVDGLRDRTLIHFDGDPHKPKLIGITSCSEGVGVTSIAAGLAGALSETGDGNVLLLHLNADTQAVHPFYRGELSCGLADALEKGKRHQGMVLQNLYVATAGNSAEPDAHSLPKQLARAVPKLRVSDYEYIVFDLPPTTPTTMTARLAGMMDLVMLVVESEKDTQEAVRQAATQLSRSKAHISAVLNKVRNPVPLWLQKAQ